MSAPETGSGMSDASTPLAEIKAAMADFVRDRDWEQFHAPKNLSMAISAEAGELQEHFLWLEAEASRGYMEDAANREAVASELADIFLFTLSFANATGIDLSAAAAAKLKRNGEKYPVEKARGTALKYDKL